MSRSRFDWNSILSDHKICEDLCTFVIKNKITEYLNNQKAFSDLILKYGRNETKKLAKKALIYRGIIVNFGEN